MKYSRTEEAYIDDDVNIRESHSKHNEIEKLYNPKSDEILSE